MTLFKGLVQKIEDIYGSVVITRMIDIAVYIEYTNREDRKRFVGLLTQIPKKYNTGVIDFYRSRKYAMVGFEDEWLAQHKISRQWLRDITSERDNAVYFSTSFEDMSRKRFLNSVTGYVYCHQRTSGWDPSSSVCPNCRYCDRCKDDLERSYPLIYQQRNEKEV